MDMKVGYQNTNSTHPQSPFILNARPIRYAILETW